MSDLGVNMRLVARRNGTDLKEAYEQEIFENSFDKSVIGNPGASAALDVVLLPPLVVVIMMVEGPMEIVLDRLVAPQEEHDIESILL